MINVAIVGYGNICRGVEKAVQRNADKKLVALFTRRPEQVKKEVKDITILHSQEGTLPGNLRIDVAILCGGSRQDTPIQGPYFARRFNTVDSFDTHADIPTYFQKMDA